MTGAAREKHCGGDCAFLELTHARVVRRFPDTRLFDAGRFSTVRTPPPCRNSFAKTFGGHIVIGTEAGSVGEHGLLPCTALLGLALSVKQTLLNVTLTQRNSPCWGG